MSKIVFENLSKKFKSNLVLDNFNLKVENGEFITLLGPSGCGKTTTLQLLAGFTSPDGGKIIVNDELISSPKQVLPPEKRKMSLIFQSYAIWPHLSVFENVAFGLKLQKIGRKEIKEKVFCALALVYLDKLANRYPNELSGGQQQRIALARAVVVEPSILLLDEPLSNLDANLREVMRNEIFSLHKRLKLTTVYVTHDQSEALALADRVVVMKDGEIQQVGSPQNIYEQPQTIFVAEFIGRCNLLRGKLKSKDRVLVGNRVFEVVPTEKDLAIGSDVVICIRPHAIAIDSHASESMKFNQIKATVDNSRYLGEFRQYQLQIENTETILTAIVLSSVNVPPNSKVTLSIPTSSCLILPTDC